LFLGKGRKKSKHKGNGKWNDESAEEGRGQGKNIGKQDHGGRKKSWPCEVRPSRQGKEKKKVVEGNTNPTANLRGEKGGGGGTNRCAKRGRILPGKERERPFRKCDRGRGKRRRRKDRDIFRQIEKEKKRGRKGISSEGGGEGGGKGSFNQLERGGGKKDSSLFIWKKKQKLSRTGIRRNHARGKKKGEGKQKFPNADGLEGGGKLICAAPA